MYMYIVYHLTVIWSCDYYRPMDLTTIKKNIETGVSCHEIMWSVSNVMWLSGDL